jgi:hypothetical protein
MVDIEVLHMSMILNQNFDYEGGDDLALGLPSDLDLMAIQRLPHQLLLKALQPQAT